MKKCTLVLLLLCLTLSGCRRAAPMQAADGAAWSSDWVTVGNVIGVDTPEDMTVLENSDVLNTKGMYCATWSMGSSEPYTNEDGDEVALYDAQLYLLLASYKSAEKAADGAEGWLALAREHYDILDEFTAQYNGQDFTVISYTFRSETNPFARGVSAFGVYGSYAVSVELSCRETFAGDPQEILAGFLERCHYST